MHENRFCKICYYLPFLYANFYKSTPITAKLHMTVMKLEVSHNKTGMVLIIFKYRKIYILAKSVKISEFFMSKFCKNGKKTTNPFPLQPEIDMRELILIFEFLPQKTTVHQISSKSETCRFHEILVLRNNWC